MLTALVLICSLAQTPDLQACSRDNAVMVIRVPTEFGNPAMCFMQAQAYIGQTSFAEDLTADERVKVVCTVSNPVDTATTRRTTVE